MAFLLEDGTDVLLEDGTDLLLESDGGSVPPPPVAPTRGWRGFHPPAPPPPRSVRWTHTLLLSLAVTSRSTVSGQSRAATQYKTATRARLAHRTAAPLRLARAERARVSHRTTDRHVVHIENRYDRDRHRERIRADDEKLIADFARMLSWND